jgi:hypothetical protein
MGRNKPDSNAFYYGFKSRRDEFRVHFATCHFWRGFWCDVMKPPMYSLAHIVLNFHQQTKTHRSFVNEENLVRVGLSACHIQY